MTTPQNARTDSILLEASGLSKTFRGLRAVDGYSVRLRSGEILGIIGPNGAGKSTLFNLLTGHLRPTAGRILFRGQETTTMAPDRIARLGIGRTFQNIRLIPSMTVLDNVVSARQIHGREPLVTTLLSGPSFRRREAALSAQARDDLRLFGLEDRASVPATALSYGDQRRLEIVRALALEPSLLLLDEPTAGMNAQESRAVMDLIRRIHETLGLAIILVEHNMPVVMELCGRVQVLNYGQTIAEGTPEEIRADARVVESYLGQAEDDAEAARR